MPQSLREKHKRTGVDFRLGLGNGTWGRILYANSKKQNRVRPHFESRPFYDSMVRRGIFEKCYDRAYYRLTPEGKKVAEWIISVLPQNQVNIRWKMIPR